MSQLLRQAQLAEDRILIARCTAAAARSGVEIAPEWVQRHAWQLATTEGWTSGTEGQASISDEEIFARIAALTRQDATESPA